MSNFLRKILNLPKNLFRYIFAYLKYNFRTHLKTILVVVLFLILLLAIVYGVKFYFRPTPPRTVSYFIASLEKKDFKGGLEYIYPSDREKLEGALKLLELTEIEFSNLKIRTVEEKGTRAKVEIEGKVKMKFLGKEKEEEIRKILDLIKEEGKWYLRTLPLQK